MTREETIEVLRTKCSIYKKNSVSLLVFDIKDLPDINSVMKLISESKFPTPNYEILGLTILDEATSLGINCSEKFEFLVRSFLKSKYLKYELRYLFTKLLLLVNWNYGDRDLSKLLYEENNTYSIDKSNEYFDLMFHS